MDTLREFEVLDEEALLDAVKKCSVTNVGMSNFNYNNHFAGFGCFSDLGKSHNDNVDRRLHSVHIVEHHFPFYPGSNMPAELPLFHNVSNKEYDKSPTRDINEHLRVDDIEHHIPTYRRVVKEVRRKMFGIIPRTKQEESYEKEVKVQPVMCDEVLARGPHEKLCLLSYGVAPTANDPPWITGRRRGQFIIVNILLPESLMHEVVKRTKENSLFMRKLVEKLILENVGVSEKDWREGENPNSGPMRPMYEQWAQAKGGVTKMLIEEPTGTSRQREETILEIKS